MSTIDVIIPVYNTQLPILKRTLDSLAAQTFQDWHGIVVDDGSSADVASFLDSAASCEPRFSVIHQANAGVSAARNRGLDEVCAPFLSFLDSDDVLDGGFLERALKELQAADADIYVASLQCIREETITEIRQAKEGIHMFTGSGMIHSLLDYAISSMPRENTRVLGNALVARLYPKLFKSGIACKFRFAPNVRISEDSLFAFQTYAICQSVVVDSRVGYSVRLTENSLSRGKEPGKALEDLQSLLAVFSADGDKLKSMGLEDAYRARLLLIFQGMANAVARMDLSWRERKEAIKRIIHAEGFADDLRHISLSEYAKNLPSSKTRHKRVVSRMLKLPEILRLNALTIDNLMLARNRKKA